MAAQRPTGPSGWRTSRWTGSTSPTSSSTGSACAHRKGAPDTFDAAGYAHSARRLQRRDRDPGVRAGVRADARAALAAALAGASGARLVITEGNYLLLDDPVWPRARAAIDKVWFVAGEDGARTERLVARHVRFGKTAEQARAWVATTDQRNAELVSTTRDKADRVIVNDAASWMLTR